VCNSTVLPYCCFIFCVLLFQNMPCLQLMLLVGWQEGHPACKKNWVVGCWHGYLSGARCRLAYGPADASSTHCLASVKSRLFLLLWYRLTQVVLEKGPSNVCVCAYYSNIQKCILIWYTVFPHLKVFYSCYHAVCKFEFCRYFTYVSAWCHICNEWIPLFETTSAERR